MITESAFLSGLSDGIQKPASIRTSLNAKAATDAVLGINQDRAIGGIKSSTDRADLHASGVFAQVTQLRHEKGMLDLFLRDRQFRKTVHPAVWTIH
jgi:hypothetical protein